MGFQLPCPPPEDLPNPRIEPRSPAVHSDSLPSKPPGEPKETISKVKRQPSEWEKIIANETTDKGLISKIYKQFMHLRNRKRNIPIKKWSKT